jgi:hypothetical protein
VASELLWGLHAWYRRSQHAVASRVPLAARTFMWGFLQPGRPGWTERRQEPVRLLRPGEHLTG